MKVVPKDNFSLASNKRRPDSREQTSSEEGLCTNLIKGYSRLIFWPLLCYTNTRTGVKRLIVPTKLQLGGMVFRIQLGRRILTTMPLKLLAV